MTSLGYPKNSNPFENDNARNSTAEDLPRQFVWTKSFERLISPKNHIILGARGSGKTAIVKMLSHEYLARLKHPKAVSLIRSRKFIGIYVPMRLSWVGGLKNKKWLSESEQENHFQWRLNISCCASYLATLRSCIDCYSSNPGERALTEREVAREIGLSWFEKDEIYTIRELRSELADLEYRKLLEEQRARISELTVTPGIGYSFELGLFEPLKRAIDVTKRHIDFPSDAAWAVCLDEAEYLSKFHHVILNSHLRTFADGLVFKITTMPYKHYTLDTNTSVPLNRKDDFSYIYLDNLETSRRASSEFESLKKFCESIFAKRIAGSAWGDSGVTLESLLGSSYLLSNEERIDQEGLLNLIDKYANENTRRRARDLFGTKKFDDEVGRKLKGALLLRDLASSHRGNSRTVAYSGYEMVIRCSDGNPRRLISLLNSFYNANEDGVGFKPIPSSTQDRILRLYSFDEYKRMISEPNQGERIYGILSLIGKFFRDSLHNQKLSTDIRLCFKFNLKDKDAWSVIEEAIGLGLVRPIVERSDYETLPYMSGVFRLSYILSPHFDLLPRRGKDVALSTILSFGIERGVERGVGAYQMELI
ncbi:hypothetical protein QK360_11320 [Pseudomonas aeruginosa]|uniref:ORC-CDC6 family AAA ATPase n=1 Tax=Pseudomonas aeruginosa TaxID=287 RepID=UPI00033ACBFE|nr:hypothetical protein [Pseudomonas aeruginosa]ARI05606.1 hypothetical protein Y880_05890 [Pseudomonas aeruginosa PAK]AXR08864.1 hypothetical protein DZ899_01340 [Pseudomonas aeruginosa]EOT25229.1 hypothetical protein PAK_00470 [Pseudomonas aeruginosa PAK]MBG4227193.1 hypothetical protein [Pseudomonas aeruginosa]MBG4238877.1 hypothetical protein [Pseudomonas aeruginosa]